MQYRQFGTSGLRIAPLVLGTDNFANPTPRDEAFAIMDAALAAGVNMIDTSNSYARGECESLLGDWMQERGNRDQVSLATKVFYATGPGPNERGLSRTHIVQACEASLRRLQTDRIDLYQTHRPDMNVPLEETLRALDDLIHAGKVRYIGSSTAPAWHVVESVMTSRALGLNQIISEQSPYNLLERRIENELLPACIRHGLAVITWSPLAMGMLAGRYNPDEVAPADSRAALRGGLYAERVTTRGVQVGNAFAAMARAAGHDPAQLALLWVKDQPGITAPIIGPRTLDQLTRSLPVLEQKLAGEMSLACDAICAPGSVTASFFNSAAWMSWKVL